MSQKNYIVDRQTKKISKYGLQRRTEVIVQQFRQFGAPTPCTILDIGTADGLILRSVTEAHGMGRTVGIGTELNPNRVKSAKENVTYLSQSDGRQLPFCDDSVDVIISTAVFKHIVELDELVWECRRVLKPGGKIIITDPTPLGIRFGLLLGHFSRHEIVHTLNLRTTQELFDACGFKVTTARRFMASPVPFFGVETVERVLNFLSLDPLFFNQVVCAEALP